MNLRSLNERLHPVCTWFFRFPTVMTPMAAINFKTNIQGPEEKVYKANELYKHRSL